MPFVAFLTIVKSLNDHEHDLYTSVKNCFFYFELHILQIICAIGTYLLLKRPVSKQTQNEHDKHSYRIEESTTPTFLFLIVRREIKGVFVLHITGFS